MPSTVSGKAVDKRAVPGDKTFRSMNTAVVVTVGNTHAAGNTHAHASLRWSQDHGLVATASTRASTASVEATATAARLAAGRQGMPSGGATAGQPDGVRAGDHVIVGPTERSSLLSDVSTIVSTNATGTDEKLPVDEGSSSCLASGSASRG